MGILIKKLNFGCGKKIFEGWVNADIQKGKGIDKSFNFDKFPYPLKDDEFDYVLVDNVLEHLENISKVLDEIHRISKNNARIEIKVPWYHCKAAMGDPTHKHYFADDTFDILLNVHKHYGVEKFRTKYIIEKTKLIPTRFGKIFPPFIRRYAGYVLGEIYSQIEVTLKVVK